MLSAIKRWLSAGKLERAKREAEREKSNRLHLVRVARKEALRLYADAEARGDTRDQGRYFMIARQCTREDLELSRSSLDSAPSFGGAA